MSRRIEDFGEKIGGAKKDQWTTISMVEQDLETLNERERVAFVTKENIWPKPDYKELVKVMPPYMAYLLKKIRDSIPIKVPVRYSSSEENFREYIHFVRRIREVVEAVQSDDDLVKICKNVFGDEMTCTKDSWRLSRRASLWVGLTTNKTFLALQIFNGTINTAKREIIKTGWPETLELWMRRFSFALTEDGRIRIFADHDEKAYFFDSRQEGLEWARKYAEERGWMEYDNKRLQISRPRLSEVKRIGIPYRDGDVTEDMFMEAFRFRGCEFGNWISNDERQQSLNMAYDSLMDLASTLGMNSQQLSLNGTLAVAFGSRGSGSALAHYETTYKVINLTKMNGAGALAHEWGHAFDDYLGQLSGDRSAARPFVSSYQLDKSTKFTPVQANAVTQVMNSLYYRKLDAELVEATIKSKNEAIKSLLMGLTRDLGKSGPRLDERTKNNWLYLANMFMKNESDRPRIMDAMDRLFKAVLNRSIDEVASTKIHDLMEDIAELRVGMQEKRTRTMTNYYEGAREVDQYRSKRYWTLPEEMFARAFECYVFDTLAAKSYVSDYLVHGVENDLYGDYCVYPAGIERQSINRAFETLFETRLI